VILTKKSIFLKFLSLFTEKIPVLRRLDLKLNDSVDINCLSVKWGSEFVENDPSLSLDHFEEQLLDLLKCFFEHRDKFVRVIDLLNASVQNKTAEISFLNLTTGFEVYHKYFREFKENETIREQLWEELNLAGLVQNKTKKWEQILRYAHLFRLMDDVEFFKKNIPNPKKTIELMKDSRNYYTHYSSTTKEIWTPNRLIYSNIYLRQLLKGVLLKELGLKGKSITRLLNYRFASLFHHYEKNEFSVLYLKDEKSKFENIDDTV
jgi:hypothetical protein